jgi:DNA-binding FadR family transcriptional regulator
MEPLLINRPASLVEAVCRELALLIRNTPLKQTHEHWLPGERSLAETLGVSRSVVREATKRLEQQGMVEIQHGNGIKIVDRLHRPLSASLSLLIPDVADRLQQLNETRLSIEPDAAGYAAERASAEHVSELWRIHRALESAPDNAAAIQWDLTFHRTLADASGNLIYRLMLDSLGEIGLASRMRTIGRLGKAAAVAHHATILEALERRDPGAAREAMRMHILAAGDDMELHALKTNAPAQHG